MSKKFKVIHQNYGEGRHAKVSLIKRKSDKKLFIWKRPRSDNPAHQRVFQEEHRRSKIWRELGISDVYVEWCPDNKSLLKTYIKGHTLAYKLKKDGHLFAKTDKKSMKELKKLFSHLIDSNTWVRDLGNKNLVFDGDRWQVIDSSDIFKMENRDVTKQIYKEELVKKWSKRALKKLSNHDIRHIRSFFDSI